MSLSSVFFRSCSEFFLVWPFFLLTQNTYTNADKLLEAAEQLAQTGECDPEEIYQAAHQLEDRIQDFVRRVEQRKVLLDMSVAFHTHVKEVGAVTEEDGGSLEIRWMESYWRNQGHALICVYFLCAIIIINLLSFL